MRIIFILFVIFLTKISLSANITSIASGNWGDPLIWDSGTVPLSTDDVVIDELHTVDVLDNLSAVITVTVNSIKIGDVASASNADNALNIPAGSVLNVTNNILIERPNKGNTEWVLNVAGIVNAGSLDMGVGGTSASNSRRAELRIADDALVDIAGNFSMNSFHTDTRTNGIYFTDIAGVNPGELHIGGVFSNGNIANMRDITGGCVVRFDGASTFDLGFMNYNYLELAGSGSYSISSITSVTGDLIMSGTASFSTGSNNLQGVDNFSMEAGNTFTLGVANQFNVSAGWTNNGGVFIPNTSTVLFNGITNINQIITNSTGTETFYNLSFGTSSGTAVGSQFVPSTTNIIVTNDVNLFQGDSPSVYEFRMGVNNLTVGNDIIFNNSDNNNKEIALTLSTGTIDVDGNIDMLSNDLRHYIEVTGNGTIKCGGDLTGGDVDFTGGAGTIILEGSNPSIIGGPHTTGGGDSYQFYNFQNSKANTATLGDGIDVFNDFTLNSGVLDVDVTNNHEINVGGDWTNNSGLGGFEERNGTVTFDGRSGIQSISALSNTETFYNLESTGTSTNLQINAPLVVTVLNDYNANANSELSGDGELNTTNDFNFSGGSQASLAGAYIVGNNFTVDGGANVTYTGTSMIVSNLTSTMGNDSKLTFDGAGFVSDKLLLDGARSLITLSSGVVLINTSTDMDKNGAGNAARIVVNGGELDTPVLNMNNGTGSTSPGNLCYIEIGNGDVDISGDLTMNGTRQECHVEWSGNGVLHVGGDITGGGIGDYDAFNATGEVHLDGTNQTIGGVASTYGGNRYLFGTLRAENSGVKTLGERLYVYDMIFAQTATFDVSTSNFDVNVYDDWSVVGTIADPFLEQDGIVYFLGTDGTDPQELTNVNGGSFAFHNFTVNNTGGRTPAVTTSANLALEEHDHTSGQLDLLGNDINVSGNGNTSFLSGGSVVTSVAGSTYDVTEPAVQHTIDFQGTQIGDATNDINVTCNNARIFTDGSTFFGNCSFTKTDPINRDDCDGGNVFNGDVIFNVPLAKERWRTANTNPDIYNGALTINHDGIGNFCLGRGTVGNTYNGKVTLNSSTVGGIFIGRENNGAPSEATFNDDFEANLTNTGNINVSNGMTGAPSDVTFNGSKIVFTSTSGSTGNFSFGEDDEGEIFMINGAHIEVNGTTNQCLGATSVFLRNISQTSTATSNILVEGTSNVLVGETASNSFDGEWNITSPSFSSIRNNTFNADVTLTKSALSTNSNASNNGSNVFNGDVTITLNSNNGNDWFFATSDANDYNGNAVFEEMGGNGSDLQIARNFESTFAGDITCNQIAGAHIRFGDAAGRVIMDGVSTQTISSSNTTTDNAVFEEIELDCAGPVELGSYLQVTEQAVFTNGVVNSDNTNYVFFENENVNTNRGDDNSYVNGPLYWLVKNAGTHTMTAPTGKNPDWRPVDLEITHANNTDATYRYEAFIADVNLALGSTGQILVKPATIDTVSHIHFWHINRIGGSTYSGQAVTLHYKSNVNPDVVPFPTELTIAQSDGPWFNTSLNWIDIGGTGTGVNDGDITSTAAFTDFGVFTLADTDGPNNNPLPIELLSFDATLHNDLVDLEWITASEKDNDYFVVERSADGQNWEDILVQPGAGTSFIQNTYSDLDNAPLNGISFYRLRQVDTDDSFTHSNTVAVDRSKLYGDFSVYPNPNTDGNINIKFDKYNDEDLTVTIVDANGKLIYNELIGADIRGKFHNIMLNDLPKGVYFIKAITNSAINTKKLILAD